MATFKFTWEILVVVAWHCLFLFSWTQYSTVYSFALPNTSGSPSGSNSAYSQEVRLADLLSTCVDACFIGCPEIRRVQRNRQTTGSLESLFMKNILDPKSALTEADGAAQIAIVGALQREWGPQLRIVGEEDDDIYKNNSGGSTNESDIDGPDSEIRTSLKRDWCSILSKDTTFVSLADVTIYVDPLDGTREFVEGRLSNCQTLIGIAVNEQAVAGAIGIPFPDGTLDKESTVIFGQVGAGYDVVGSTPLLPSNPQFSTTTRPRIATGDSTTNVMKAARSIALQQKEGGGTCVLYGGAGNKILSTATGQVDCTIQHCYGGPWDTCAPAAVLRSMGGRISNLLGEDLFIRNDVDNENACNLGFVATGADSVIDHDELLRALNDSPLIQDSLFGRITSKVQ